MATGTIMPLPRFTGFDANGDPVPGGLLFTTIAGTSTPIATYTDVALTVPHANPIVLNSAGRPAAGGSELGVYLTPGTSYKFVLQTADGATVWTQDQVAAVPTSSQTVDVVGTAGEALGANAAVYLSTGVRGKTAGQWFLTDADFPDASSVATLTGVTLAAIPQAASGTIRTQGAVPFAGTPFTPGSVYYASATPGALTTALPVNVRSIGQALDLTTLLLGAGVTAALGIPVDVPYAAGDYTTSPAGTWTVPSANVVTHRYALLGKTAVYFFHVTSSTVSAGVTVLRIKNPIPGATGEGSGTCVCGATTEMDVALTNTGDSNINLVRPPGTAWPTSTGDLRVAIAFLLP
jgi:hypothetical protein